MIVCLNHYRCYRHERTCDYQAYGCYDYIQSTLCEGVFRLEHGTLGAHNRHAKRLYVLSACYDYVTGVRYKIAVYIFIYARFDYAIAERRFYAGYDNSMIAIQVRQNFKNIFGIFERSLNRKALAVVSHFVQLFVIFLVFIDDQSFHRIV